MTTRIGSQIFRGELINIKRNGVHGWIDFGGDWGVRLELTGNMSDDLAGKHVRFQATQPTSDADCLHAVLNDLVDNQCGCTGEMQLRKLAGGGTCLFLEWFSQNGQIIAEIPNPLIEFGPAEEAIEPVQDAEIETPTTAVPDDLDFLGSNEEPADDPYQLFPADLDQQLARANDAEAATSAFAADALDEVPEEFLDSSSDVKRHTRSWDEVIPGIDPETKRMYEEWDEVIHGTKDVPFMSLFDPPLTLKKPAEIADEAEAVQVLRVLLARLALHCVVIHMCPHYTAREMYRWLIEDLLPREGVHPQLKPTGFVRFYDTAEHCEQCDAEFEERWNAKKDRDPE